MAKKQKEELALAGEVPAVRLKAPKGASSVSVGGEEYAVEEGHVVVPAGSESELVAHGFTEEE